MANTLESNKLKDPRANFLGLWGTIALGFIMVTWIFWDLVIIIGNNIAQVDNASSPDVVLTALSPWTTSRGLFWSDFIGIAIYFILLLFIFWCLFRHKMNKKIETRIDSYASSMGYGKAVQGLLEKTCKKKAKRLLKLNKGEPIPPGIKLGNLVYNNDLVYSDWEAEMLVVAGPRTGKTISYVIPTIAIAPGACIATSNKRDIVDATKHIREAKGKVWLFDPERIASGEASWYWNPINSIRNLEDAQRIANCWRAVAGLADKSGNNEFFSGGAADQLATYLFAASLDNLTMTDVFKWCQNEKDDTPAIILTKHKHDTIAKSVYGVLGITPETKSGIFAGLKKMVSFVVDEKLTPWIQLMSNEDEREEFDPFSFALSKDTLYLLSQKGAKSTPITAALTAIVSRAGYDISQNMGGRLPLPLVGVLDECANICPWPEMPEIYSYYGSCGIILISLFQNVSQGYLAFGKEGFKSLFDNANTKIYLGGNTDTEFLQQLSTIVGQHDVLSHSVQDNLGFTHSETRNLRQEKILTEAQLAEWPFGRALVLSSQNRATIVKTIPWYEDKKLKAKIEHALSKTKLELEENFDLSNLTESARSRKLREGLENVPPSKSSTIEANSEYIESLKQSVGKYE
jgi:type IV secretory pathway TraG/TraD family ATPase VirD4